MKVRLTLAFVALVWQAGSPVIQVSGQSPALREKYEQALRAAQAKEFERAYDLSVKLVSQDLLYYEANVLRVALAAILKKTGPEDPQNLLRVLKGRAPLGSNPEQDAQSMINRLTGTPSVSEPKPAAAISPYVRNKLALVVGIGTFKDPKINRLLFTTNDARGFSDTLKKQCGFSYVQVLLNENATTYNIKTEMDKLAKKAGPEDLVVIYIASHGSPEDLDVAGVNYIVTYDTEVENLYATAYKMSDLLDDVKKRISAERIVAFLDTCYSGATFKEPPKDWTGGRGLKIAPYSGLRSSSIEERLRSEGRDIKIAPAPANVGGKKQGVGRVVIASSGQDQKAWESETIQHGYFTHFLIQALNSSKSLSIQALYEYLKKEVPQAVRRERNAEQNPTMASSTSGPIEIYLKDQ